MKRRIVLLCTVCLLSIMLSGFSPALKAINFKSMPDENEKVLLLGLASGEVIHTNIPVYADGIRVSSGYKVGAVTYVPVREFCGAIETDGLVNWDQEHETVLVTTDELDLSVGVGDNYMIANNRCFYLPKGVFNLGGTVVMPVRELAQCFGVDITWNELDWSVEVSEKELAYLEEGNSYYDAEDLYWLSRIIHAEAGNQSLEGMIAVGNVVLNRVDDPTCPDTIHDVIFDDRYGVQFHPTENGAIYEEPNELSLVAARICLEGYEIVGDSLFFVNHSIGSIDWFNDTRTYVATIGDHTFFS